jgi:hypothetical protein
MNAGIVDQDRDIASDFFDLRSYLRRLCRIRDVQTSDQAVPPRAEASFAVDAAVSGLTSATTTRLQLLQRQRNFFTQTLASAGYYRRLSVKIGFAVNSMAYAP